MFWGFFAVHSPLIWGSNSSSSTRSSLGTLPSGAAQEQTGETSLFVNYLWRRQPAPPFSPCTGPSQDPPRRWCGSTPWFWILAQSAGGPLCSKRSLHHRSCSLAWCRVWISDRNRWAHQACGCQEPSGGCLLSHTCHHLLWGTNPPHRCDAHRHSGRPGLFSSTVGPDPLSYPSPLWGSQGPPQSSWKPQCYSGASKCFWHAAPSSPGC